MSASSSPTFAHPSKDAAPGAVERPDIVLDDAPMKKHENLSQEQLEHLRVSDDELVGDLTFNQLSLFEKKSVLVRLSSVLLACRRS
jgi:hypothetical protein